MKYYQICECESLQETVASLKQQLADAIELRNFSPVVNHSQHFPGTKDYHGELYPDKGNMDSTNEGNLMQAQVYFFTLWPSSLGAL